MGTTGIYAKDSKYICNNKNKAYIFAPNKNALCAPKDTWGPESSLHNPPIFQNTIRSRNILITKLNKITCGNTTAAY